MLSTEEAAAVERARSIAAYAFSVGPRYIQEAEVTVLATGFHILDKEARYGE